MAYLGHSLEKATADMVAELGDWKCGAGLVAVDRHGNVVLPYNTEGLYRGSVTSLQPATVAIYE